MVRRSVLLASFVALVACGYSGVATTSSPSEAPQLADASQDGGAGIDSGLVREEDPTPIPTGDGSVEYVDAGDPDATAPFDGGVLPGSPGPPLIYVLSTRLWTFNPVSGQWGGGTSLPANNCPSLDELAVDPYGALFAVGQGGSALYRVDPSALTCTAIGAGGMTYPQALAFAPRGTRNPYVEELVGYGANGDYVRIDRTTGALSLVKAGVFAGYSVGDLINVGMKGYVVLTGGTCGTGDCLWEVSLATGDKIGAAATINAGRQVTGLGHWGGRLYAFGAPDDINRIDPASPGAAVGMNGPPGFTNVAYRGAGSRTIAPTQ